MKTRYAVPFAMTFLATFSLGSFAGSSTSNETLSIGAIVYSEPSVYTGGKRNEDLLPYVEWESENWFFRNYSLGSYLATGDDWYLTAGIGYDAFGDYQRGDSSKLKDMKKLDPVYSAAVSAGVYGSFGHLDLSYLQDISDNHGGGVAVLRYSLPFEAQNWTIEPHISMTYAGPQAARYYLGVEAADAKAGRPEYRPDRALRYRSGINISRLFGGSHRVLFDLSHNRYSGEVKDSPIVDRDSTWGLSAGYVYEF